MTSLNNTKPIKPISFKDDFQIQIKYRKLSSITLNNLVSFINLRVTDHHMTYQ